MRRRLFSQSDNLFVRDKCLADVHPFLILPDLNKLRRCETSGMPIITESDIAVLEWRQYQALPPGRGKRRLRGVW